ncbi:MAG TPA: 5'-methylthioadenosine/S-adenosylhomocysteine nucleosidase [Kiritimatiellia bacterium]|nr:5'-methylthioadenosine/S-adenosylhomocysteine nucleosidase [Kiritimatiellia bacterium]HMO99510.1 5'-methylthioadenosine/S-adenosylhomocysteine nucleosidase [Kiritimatiellia bacterium]HMP91019.1 5'-methylthioadenosine/S-adenosylhomocysteine nucleosidase [Kiritimatiellia bacterium]
MGWPLVGTEASGDTIALFYALDRDLTALKREADEFYSTIKVGRRSLSEFRVGDHKVVAVQMGSGNVESALSAQALLSQFRCDLAISIGPAGCLDTCESLVGTWHRVDRVTYAPKGTETASGFQLHERSTLHLNVFFRDPATGINDDWPSTPTTLVSGEAFISSQAAREKLYALTDAPLVDMNSYGVAMACIDHRVPLLLLRVVSDMADESAGDSFRNFIASYDGEGARLGARLIRKLDPNPDAPESYPNIRRVLSAGTLDEAEKAMQAPDTPAVE